MTTENLIRLYATDDRPERAAALRAEAVEQWRRLIADRPSASVVKATGFLLGAHGVSDERVRAEDFRTVAGQACPGRGAQLLAAYAAHLAGRGDHDAALATLQHAAARCDTEQNTAILGEGRRSVRRAVQALLRFAPQAVAIRNWPAWAATPADSEVLAATDDWLAADLDGREELLRTRLNTFTGPQATATLAIAQAMHPGDTGSADLRDALDAIAERGLEKGLAYFRAEAEHSRLLDEWAAIADTAASVAFLRDHPSLPADPRTHPGLEKRTYPGSVPVSIQHLAGHVELDDLSAAIADADAADDLVLRLIEAGHVHHLAPLLEVLPGPALGAARRAEAAALAALGSDPADLLAASERMQAARDVSTVSQRAFIVSRMRLLARSHPQLRNHLAAMTQILTSDGSPAS